MLSSMRTPRRRSTTRSGGRAFWGCSTTASRCAWWWYPPSARHDRFVEGRGDFFRRGASASLRGSGARARPLHHMGPVVQFPHNARPDTQPVGLLTCSPIDSCSPFGKLRALPPRARMPTHRGRLQVQGADMNPELSRPWSQDLPRKAGDALNDLHALRLECNEPQRTRRVIAFAQAQRFIEQVRAGNGIGPTSESFPRKRRGDDHSDARVDIEVKVGLAFIP